VPILSGEKKTCLHLVMLLGLVFNCARAESEQGHCAWLNAATASGFLNGPVTLDVRAASDDQGTCVFTDQKTAKGSATLRIMVEPLKEVAHAVASHESSCTSASVPIKGIGNEAVSCSADVGYSRGEQVIGRVRDRLFIVTVSSTIAKDPAMTRPLLQQKARDIAEQIAGVLF
jgi:hypothetical protein